MQHLENVGVSTCKWCFN